MVKFLRFVSPWFVAAAAGLLLSACSTVTPAAYHDQQPELRLESYFNGPLTADGLVFDRSGKVVRRFHVDLMGVWHGDSGTLTEHFTYSDGKTQERVWHLHREPDAGGMRRYTGTAGDIVGTAAGAADGNAFHWNYVLALPYHGHVIDVHMDDWMYQMNQHVLLNRTDMSKLGIHLAGLFIAFHKP